MENEKLKKSTLTHSLMLISSDECALLEQAFHIAKILMCDEGSPCEVCINCTKINHKNHPDVQVFPKEKDVLAVDEVLKIVDESFVSPYESDKKVFILNNFSQTNIQAQNKLLKTLEEPPKQVYFILNVTNEEKVLPTIKSRCHKFYLNKYNKEEILESLNDFTFTREQKIDIASFCGGQKSLALKFAEKNNFFELLDFVFDMWKNMKSSGDMVKYVGKLYEYKNDFKVFLFLFEKVLKDVLYTKLELIDFIGDTQKLETYKEIAKSFSIEALKNISFESAKFMQKIERNCNQNIMIDNFLMFILEERAKCQK